MKPNLRDVIDAFYRTPPLPEEETRLPLLTLWPQGSDPITFSVPLFNSPLENAAAIVYLAIKEGVKLDAVMFVSEMWSAPPDESGLPPSLRREAGDPAVVTAVSADYYDAEGRLSEFAMESRDDDGTTRLVFPGLDAPSVAVSDQAATFRLLAEMAVMP